MYTYILFYVLAGKFHTDVSSIQMQFGTEELCKKNGPQVLELLKEVHPDVSHAKFKCIKSQ